MTRRTLLFALICLAACLGGGMAEAASPTVTINQDTYQADPTLSSPVHFAAVFSQAVTDFTGADVTLGGTAGPTTAVVANPSGDHMTYDVSVTGMTAAGTVTAAIGAGVAHNAGSEPNLASTTSDSQVTYSLLADGSVQFVGHIGGLTRAVAVSGTRAYMAQGPSLQIVDITTPASPSVLGRAYLYGDVVNSVAVSGNYAYLACADTGLQVVNVTDPANPTRVGGWDPPVEAYGITISGNYAYLADRSGGLLIFDITTPANPVRVGHFGSTDARAVAISGNQAYVADFTGGLYVVDITNKANPTQTGHRAIPGFPIGITLDGGYAYIAASSTGLQIVDVSTPSNPTITGDYQWAGNAQAVLVSGNYANVAFHNGGMLVIDVSDKANPSMVLFVLSSGDYIDGVAQSGNYLYLANSWKGLKVLNATTPTNPTVAGTLDSVPYAEGVAVSGSYAYVAAGTAGLKIVDVTDPARPSRVGAWATTAISEGVAVSGTYAYVADGTAGLEVINASTPAGPTKSGGWTTTATSYGVAYSSNYAYLADGTAGLQVINVTNPASPSKTGTYNTSGTAYGVAYSGAYAYVADGTGGLQVINVTNPASPSKSGGWSTTATSYGVALSGNYAYVADDTAGLQVIDISTPSAPNRVGGYDTSGAAYAVAVSGNYAFVADDASGLQAFDVTTPATPSRIGGYITGRGAHGVAVSGDYVYVADQDGGMAVLRNVPPDTTAPVPTIGAPSGTLTRTGSIAYSVSFGELVSGFATGDLQLNTTGTAGATSVQVTSGSGAGPYTVTISGCTGDGTLSITVPAACCTDAAGNPNTAAGPSTAFTVDNTAPVPAIGAPSGTLTTIGPITYSVSFGEAVSGFATGDVQLNTTGTANAASVQVTSGSGAGPYTVTVSGCSGDGTLSITVPAACCIDAAGNGNTAAGPSTAFTVDNTAPVPAIGAPSGTLTTTGPITYSVSFGEAVTGFATGDVQLNTTGTANASSVLATGAGPYTVTLSGCTGDGTLSVTVPAGCCTDAAGNGNTAAGPSASFTIDNTTPTVTLNQAAGQADPAILFPILFTAVFSEPIADFIYTDVTLGGTANPSVVVVTNPSGDMMTYTLSVGQMTGPGTVTATIGAGAAHDTAGNANTASTASDDNVAYNPPTDSIPPSVTIDRAIGQADPTNASTINFTAVFSEPVAGFATGDVTISGSAGATTADVTNPTGDFATYNVAVSGMTGSGTVSVTIAEKVALDGAGNPSLASTNLDNLVAYDNVLPSATIGAPSATSATTGPVTYSVAWSEPVTGFATGDIQLIGTGTANANAQVTSGSGAGPYTVTVSGCTGDGTLSIAVLPGICADTAGNANSPAGPSTTFTVDNSAPTAAISAPSAGLTTAGPVTYSVTWSEPVTGLATGDVQLNKTGTADASSVQVTSGSGAGPYVVTVSGCTGNGTLSVSLPAACCTDAAGNTNPAAGPSAGFTVDNTAPTVTINQAAGQADPSDWTPVSFAVVFSETVTDFASGDVTLGGTAGAATAVVTGSGTTYNVAVTGMTQSGTVTASIAAGAAHDAVGNAGAASTTTDNQITYVLRGPVAKVYGLDFGPFLAGKDPSQGDRVSEAEIRQMMETVRPYTTWIRTFGTSGGLDKAGAIAHEKGLRAACGAWLGTNLPANDEEITRLINMAKRGEVDLAIVGNEALYNNYLTAQQLIGYINRVKQETPGLPVTTVDTYGALIAHSDVITACDVVMANAYPWWESIPIDGAGLDSAYRQMVAASGGKEVYISETGWPSCGASHGQAVSSPENASRYFHAVASWAQLNNVKVFYFEAFDELWKAKYEGSQGACWGIWDANLQMKPGMFEQANTTGPSVAINQAVGQADPTCASAINFMVVFSESVSDFATGDVTLSGTAGATTATVTGSGTTYNVAVSGLAQSGTVIASVAEGKAHNGAGNANTASTTTDNQVTYDITPPAVTITSPTSDPQVRRNCNVLAVSGTASDASGLPGVTCAVNGGTASACVGTTAWSLGGLVLNWGDNAVVVTATDAVGNTSTDTLAVTCTDSKPGAAWSGNAMVSLPIIPDDTDPRPVVGFDQNGWFIYEPTGYVSYPDPKTKFLDPSKTPGRGFWAYFPAAGPASPCGTIPPQTVEARIHLFQGWNCIGQPFISAVRWDRAAIQVEVGGARASLANSGASIADYAWGWDSTRHTYYLVYDTAVIPGADGQLEPWEAYWVKALAECDLILPAP